MSLQEQKTVYALETLQSITNDGLESELKCLRQYVLALRSITGPTVQHVCCMFRNKAAVKPRCATQANVRDT